MEEVRLCSCGEALDAFDIHDMCMLCLGTHDATKCLICKGMSTKVKAARRRAYRVALLAGYLIRRGKRFVFPPLEDTVVVVSEDRAKPIPDHT